MSENDARRAFQQLLMDLAVRLDFLIRSAQIYPENHPSLDSALESVCALVRSAVDGRDSVTFYPAGRRFVVDEVSVRLPRSYWSTVSQLEQWLMARGLGGMELRGPLVPEALIQVIHVLESGMTEDGPGAEVLNAAIEDAGIGALRVTPPRVEQVIGTVDDPVLAQLRVYLRGVRAIQRLHERGMSPAVLIELSQIADSMSALVERLPRSALALTESRRMVPFALSHPIHVALVAGLLGLRLGQERGVLAEIILCALCADAGKADLPGDLRRNPAHLRPADRGTSDRHSMFAVRQLLSLPELHDPLRRRMVVCIEQDLGDDLSGPPAVMRWGERHPVSRLVGLARAWDQARAAAGPGADPIAVFEQFREGQEPVHSELLLDHLSALLRATSPTAQ